MVAGRPVIAATSSASALPPQSVWLLMIVERSRESVPETDIPMASILVAL
jgi:hypothetical protein